jgi:hypothetical protein
MNIVYLSANPKYRAFMERCIEFLEQVYKDEVLADLEFLAYLLTDPVDSVEAGKFGISTFDIGSYYLPKTKRVVVAKTHQDHAVKIFKAAVEEVSHHALYGVHIVERVVEALLKDIPHLRTFATRVSERDVQMVHWFIIEFYTKYVVYNYFIELNDRPTPKPWELKDLREEITGYYKHARMSLDIESDALGVINTIYVEAMIFERSFPNFRKAIHSIFKSVIKRFPVEIYNSNPSRYEILYREQSIPELPL